MLLRHCTTGEMPEWSNGAVSKTVVRVTGPGVRIPFSPQHMTDPANGGVFYFAEGAMKACFQEHLRENKKDLKGHSCVAGSPPGIMSEANNPLCPFAQGVNCPADPGCETTRRYSNPSLAGYGTIRRFSYIYQP